MVERCALSGSDLKIKFRTILLTSMYSIVAPASTVHFYLFCTNTRASVSVHVRISAEYLYSSEHALW